MHLCPLTNGHSVHRICAIYCGITKNQDISIMEVILRGYLINHSITNEVKTCGNNSMHIKIMQIIKRTFGSPTISCVVNCSATLNKLLTQMKHHLLLANVIIMTIKFLSIEKCHVLCISL